MNNIVTVKLKELFKPTPEPELWVMKYNKYQKKLLDYFTLDEAMWLSQFTEEEFHKLYLNTVPMHLTVNSCKLPIDKGFKLICYIQGYRVKPKKRGL
jgi:hypothetical protein